MKKVVIIHTGGTISMQEDQVKGVILSDEHPLSKELFLLSKYAEIEEIEAFNYPSPHMTPQTMLQLKRVIENIIHEKNPDGIVVTHGTDTLEESAYFLDSTLTTSKPIILTGAMRSSNEIGSDGLYNLLSSVRVAVCDESANKGVLVVMNDEIHTAVNVTKTSTSNVSTFQSPQYGPIGLITKTDIHYHHEPHIQKKYTLHEINKKVALLKVYAGMEAFFLESLLQSDYDGIVLEGLGQGNVPPHLVEPISQLIQDGKPVVMVSRCYNGIAQPVYGYVGGGLQLAELGVHFAYGLSGQKARLKLLIALCSERFEADLFEPK